MELHQFNNIKASVYDEENDLLLAWQGGHGIRAYDVDGQEVLFWNLGGADEPTYKEVQAHILKAVENQDYLDRY